jgi:hypothetical protein
MLVCYTVFADACNTGCKSNGTGIMLSSRYVHRSDSSLRMRPHACWGPGGEKGVRACVRVLGAWCQSQRWTPEQQRQTLRRYCHPLWVYLRLVDRGTQDNFHADQETKHYGRHTAPSQLQIHSHSQENKFGHDITFCVDFLGLITKALEW